MKCQILFSGKSKKNIINVLSAEIVQRVVKVTDPEPQEFIVPFLLKYSGWFWPSSYEKWTFMEKDFRSAEYGLCCEKT